MGCHFLLQGIIATQGSSQSLPCLLHCRWILYHWATGEASCPWAYPLLWGQNLSGSLGVVYRLSSASYRLPSSQPLHGVNSKSGLGGAVLPPGLPGDKQEGDPGCHPITLLLTALGEQEEELRSWFQRKKPSQKSSADLLFGSNRTLFSLSLNFQLAPCHAFNHFCWNFPLKLFSSAVINVQVEVILGCTVCGYYWQWNLLSCVRLFATPWTIQSMEFSRPEHWSGWPFPSPGDLPNQGIEPTFPAVQEDSLPAEPPGKPCYCQKKKYLLGKWIISGWLVCWRLDL